MAASIPMSAVHHSEALAPRDTASDGVAVEGLRNVPVTAHNALHAVASPARSGASLPTDPMLLMRQLRAAEKSEAKSHVSSLHLDNRIRRQEQQREQVEIRLMEFEDYTYTDEGMHRARAFQDRIQM